MGVFTLETGVVPLGMGEFGCDRSICLVTICRARSAASDLIHSSSLLKKEKKGTFTLETVRGVLTP